MQIAFIADPGEVIKGVYLLNNLRNKTINKHGIIIKRSEGKQETKHRNAINTKSIKKVFR